VWKSYLVLIGVAIASPIALLSSRPDIVAAPADKPAHDRISALNERLERGAASLSFQPTTGYLRSVLETLDIPVESQVMVFSPTSFEAKLIDQENPRALYLTDDVVIGWVRGSSLLEAVAVDPGQGAVFYTLDQTPAGEPRFQRNDSCLSCHQSQQTSGVPGLFVLSNGAVVDHRTPLNERWGGWYVTGFSNRFRHLGNRIGQGWLESLYDQFDYSGYLTEYSDMVALMALEHQTHATNLLTRLALDGRNDNWTARARDDVNDLVDYLLFLDEASLPGKIIGTSGFAEKFATLGPSDRKGRSLRQFDLAHRMMRYPCSYMVYSQSFDALSAATKAAVYARMWEVLSGRAAKEKYARLSFPDREAVIEILRDTKKDLPPYFKPIRSAATD
jgi:hypothetical protein